MSGSKDDDASSTASGASQPGEGGTPASVLSSTFQAATFPGKVTVDSPSQSDGDDLLPHCSECGVKLGLDAVSCAVCGLILCNQHLTLGQHHDNRPDCMTVDGAPLCSGGSGVFAAAILAPIGVPPTALAAPPPLLTTDQGLCPAVLQQLQGLNSMEGLQQLLTQLRTSASSTGSSASGLAAPRPPAVLPPPPPALETCLLCQAQQPLHMVKAILSGGFQCQGLQECTSRQVMKATQAAAPPPPPPPPPPLPTIYPDPHHAGVSMLRGNTDRFRFLLGLTNVTRFGVPPTEVRVQSRSEFKVQSQLQATLTWVCGRLSAQGVESKQILE